MQLIIRYADGRRAEALLLLESPDFFRISMPGEDDAVDLRHVDGNWVDEGGRRVSIEAVLAAPTTGACAAAAGGGLS